MRFQRQFQAACFNTQPPEGGWVDYLGQLSADDLFQHTAARRRLATGTTTAPCAAAVSTHSRPKAAGTSTVKTASNGNVSTHSRPKAAGPGLISISSGKTVSTHSRPKAAGASLKSFAPSGFAALISLSSQEKREREYNTAFSVTPAFSIS